MLMKYKKNKTIEIKMIISKGEAFRKWKVVNMLRFTARVSLMTALISE